MKTVLVIPIAIALFASCGGALLIAGGRDAHVREMLFAANACLIASELALVPMFLTRGASQPAVAQAGLLSTMIHLFVCTASGAVMILMKSLGLGNALLYWLLAFYWFTLIVLVTVIIRAVRQAPIAAQTAPKQT